MIARDFAAATITASLHDKDVRYAVAPADQRLPDITVSHATLARDAEATDAAPGDDEAKMIEIVSRKKA